MNSWLVGGLIVAALVIAYLLFRRFFRRQRREVVEPDLRIDVASFGLLAVPTAPQLCFEGVPMRLVVAVLAPSGRGERLPPQERWRDLLETVCPGLSDVAQRHGAQIRQWPPQLSSKGFVHSFFRNLIMPGQKGRGTPWCAVAGPARGPDGKVFLVGLVLQASQPVFFACQEIEYEPRWRQLLSVRPGP